MATLILCKPVYPKYRHFHMQLTKITNKIFCIHLSIRSHKIWCVCHIPITPPFELAMFHRPGSPTWLVATILGSAVDFRHGIWFYPSKVHVSLWSVPIAVPSSEWMPNPCVWDAQVFGYSLWPWDAFGTRGGVKDLKTISPCRLFPAEIPGTVSTDRVTSPPQTVFHLTPCRHVL